MLKDPTKSKRSILNFRPTIDDEIYALLKYFISLGKKRIGVLYDEDSQLWKDAKEKGFDNFMNYEAHISPKMISSVQNFIPYENTIFADSIFKHNDPNDIDIDVIVILAGCDLAAGVISRIEKRTCSKSGIIYGIPSPWVSGGSFNFEEFAALLNQTMQILPQFCVSEQISSQNSSKTQQTDISSKIFDRILSPSIFPSTLRNLDTTLPLVADFHTVLKGLSVLDLADYNPNEDYSSSMMEGFLVAELLIDAMGSSSTPDNFLNDINTKSVLIVHSMVFGPLTESCRLGLRNLFIGKYDLKSKSVLSLGAIGFSETCGFTPVIPSWFSWWLVVILNAIVLPIFLVLICLCVSCCAVCCVGFCISRRFWKLMQAPKGHQNLVYCFTDIEGSTKIWSVDARGSQFFIFQSNIVVFLNIFSRNEESIVDSQHYHKKNNQKMQWL